MLNPVETNSVVPTIFALMAALGLIIYNFLKLKGRYLVFKTRGISTFLLEANVHDNIILLALGVYIILLVSGQFLFLEIITGIIGVLMIFSTPFKFNNIKKEILETKHRLRYLFFVIPMIPLIGQFFLGVILVLIIGSKLL